MADITNKSDSVDAELQEVAKELEQKLGPDAVAQAEAEVREQLKGELRDRLEVAARKRAPKPPIAKPFEEGEEIERFSITFRIQHIVLFTSCIILIISGLPLKFPNTAWAAKFFHVLGGVTASGLIHRVGAVGLICVGIFHMLYVSLTREGRHNFRELFPLPRDVVDVFRNVIYFLGRAKSGARFGRFSYIEKFDYWAVYWGMVVMITSGLMLWFQDNAMAIFPKFFIDMAHEAHSDEALLATLAIIIWHFYNVHFNPDNFPMSWTWLNGKISKAKMIHHHPLEYEELVAAKRKLSGGNGKKRKPSEEQE